MARVEIDDDLFNYLNSKAEGFGESPSTVLRRLLKLDSELLTVKPPSGPPEHIAVAELEASPLLDHFALSQCTSAIDRLKLILSSLFMVHGERFGAVTKIRGRRRKYISNSVA